MSDLRPAPIRTPALAPASTRLLVLGSLLVCWLLGCWRLGEQSIWVDERFTIYDIRSAWPDFLPVLVATERRPPLYFALLKVWEGWVSSEEAALRLLSVGMVVLSVALLYALGRRLLHPRAAALAALLLAVSPFWLLYGRMMRAYSQTMMLTLAATLLLVVAVQHGRRGEQGGRGWWLAYIAAAAALIYTDYSGLPVLAAHGVYVAAEWWFSRFRQSHDREGEEMHRSLTFPDQMERRGPLVAWLLSIAVVALAYLPWLPAVLTATERSVRLTDLAGGPVGFAAKLAVPLYTWAAGETIYPWHPLGATAALVMGLLAVWGLWRVWRKAPATGALLFALLALPMLFTATLLALVATDITFLNAASRTPGAAPIYVLAAAAGLVALPRRWLRMLALACILAGTAASALNYFNGVQYLNPIYALPTRQIAAELVAQAQPGDLILAETDTLVGYYYNLAPGAATYQNVEPAANLAWIEQNQPRTVWLATFNRDSTEGAFGTAELVAGLQEGYTPGDRRGYGPVEPLYQAVKQRLTGRPAYDYKLVIQPYTR